MPPSRLARRAPFHDLATCSMLALRCESLVASSGCARGCLQVEVLCIKVVRKVEVGSVAAIEEGRCEEGVRVNKARSSSQLVAGGSELVEVEKVFKRLLVKGSVRWKSERKAHIADSEAVDAEIDRHCRSHNISAGYRVWSKSTAGSLKLGVSGAHEESRGESKLSMVMEAGLGKPVEEVVLAGLMVSWLVKELYSERETLSMSTSRLASGTSPGYFWR